MNLLDVSMPIYSQMQSVSLNWIGKIILWLTTICGSVGVGIILFSLLLKLVTLPFDVFQRISMRKQNIKMKENKERMEKLQKQYANDKEKYNQKVQEMYRENGISMMASCLPMILSLVIFIVAINAFNAFASFSNVNNYNTLVHAYNESMTQHCAELSEDTLTWEIKELSNNGEVTGKIVEYKVEDDDKYIYYTVDKTLLATVDADGNKTYEFNETTAEMLDYVKNNHNRSYQLKMDEFWGDFAAEEKNKKWIEDTENDIKQDNPEYTNEDVLKEVQNKAVDYFFISPAQDKVVEAYNSRVKEETEFLWIKNVWVVDASYKHPVLGYSDFSNEIVVRKSCSCSGGDKSILNDTAYSFDAYNDVTGKLGEQKSAPNGYFILIALSIGTILLQQFVSMRSQKEQNKYSTVDGQGGGQQKMTMIIMTGMFAVFSFMYSSAFAIYLVVSNLFSLLSTVVINKLVDVALERKAAKATVQGDKVLSGRAAAVKKIKTSEKKDKKNKK